MSDFWQKYIYIIPGFELVTWWREVDVHHFDHRWAVMSYTLRISPTFLDEFLAESLPRCFPRECQPYIPFVTEFINFLRSYGVFPHIAETSNPSNFLFFNFFGGQRSRACCFLLIKCRPKISASNSSIYSADEQFALPRIVGWTSS